MHIPQLEQLTILPPDKPERVRVKTTQAQFKWRTSDDVLNWLREKSSEYDRPINYLITHAVKQMREQMEKGNG